MSIRPPPSGEENSLRSFSTRLKIEERADLTVVTDSLLSLSYYHTTHSYTYVKSYCYKLRDSPEHQSDARTSRAAPKRKNSSLAANEMMICVNRCRSAPKIQDFQQKTANFSTPSRSRGGPHRGDAKTVRHYVDVDSRSASQSCSKKPFSENLRSVMCGAMSHASACLVMLF
jgi:hypothetical protein